MTSELSLQATVPPQKSGARFDQVAAELFPDYSRSNIQGWIRAGDLTLDGRTVKPNTKLNGGEQLVLATVLQAEGEWEAQDIPLDVVYQDECLIVINKPPGLVVHPAAGNWDGTLLNALLFHFPELRQLPRAGIVHRLDKDTSGLMVVARTLPAQNDLVNQLQARTVSRVYRAIVCGECEVTSSAESLAHVDAPIGRHPTHRTKMAVIEAGKPARTGYRVLSSFEGFSHVELKLETGRTHQIRVHMAHIGYPLVGDPVYGRSISKSQIERDNRLVPLSQFPRQALHALTLGLMHPKSGEFQSWASDLPNDFADLLGHIERVF
ncbi:MAG: 23S rRNA pseudouridine(1911/1915/1917) synthase RluD [Agarilytica sp.]